MGMAVEDKGAQIIQFKWDTLGISDTPVPLSEPFKRYTAGLVEMHRADLEFVQNLLGKYGLSDSENGQSQKRSFGRTEFFAAAADFRSYVLNLRSRLDRNFNEVDLDRSDFDIDSPIFNMYGISERVRPSKPRITNLAYLFLHLPSIKAVSMQVHAEKMIGGLPSFSRSLPDIATQDGISMHDYFDRVKELMATCMEESLDKDRVTQFQDLGLILGYEAYGILLPPRLRTKIFAAIGIGTFTKILEQVVNEAISDGKDVTSYVREEFLENRGVAYRLMRVSLKDLTRVEEGELDEMRKMLDQNNYYKGACPAILPTTTTDGQSVQRPIAFEYAATIVKHMPPG